MELMQAIVGRRSVRAFSDQPVSNAQMEKLLNAAVNAPSALNLQPWEFVVIKDPAVKQLVIEVCQEAKDQVMAADGPNWVAKYSFDFLAKAPVLLAVLYKPARGGLGEFFNNQQGALCGAAAAVQNIMLTCAEEGLGATWVTFFDPARMAAALGAPDKLLCAGVLPIGVPAGETPAPPRKAPKVHKERYAG